ncbi:MAG: nucleotidyltransferase family protein [Deltaproteobacteria bacterium]|nr:nucleotidyltransferase family protein [Deltaproteobacteria bacterium]
MDRGAPGGRIAGLVPAAGASRRLGQDKRRLPCGESTVLEATVASLRDGGLERVVLVLEPDSPCVGLPGLAAVERVVNPRPERGMLSSVREGLRALSDSVLGVAVLPGDHPFVPASVVATLVARFLEAEPDLLAPRYGLRRGHPLFVHQRLFAEAMACDDAVGLRELVWRHEARLLAVPIEAPGAEDDLDLPEHLARLRH